MKHGFSKWLKDARDDSQRVMKLTESTDIISFAGGLPAPEIFPRDQVSEAFTQVLETQSAQALQYGPTGGITELRALIAARMSQGDARFTVDNVMVTTGSQQGLDLLGKALLDEGDWVATERPTFLGCFDAWRPRQPRYVELTRANGQWQAPVPGGSALKMAYVLPDFQNPTGECRNAQERLALLSAMQKWGSVLVEDSPYGMLRYEGDDLPHMINTDAQRLGGSFYDGQVAYLGTLSKTLAPALRIGWVVAAPRLINALLKAKQGADLSSSALMQLVALQLMRSGMMDKHVPEIRALYHERRDAMLVALKQYMPDGYTWNCPEGGMFIWVTTPSDVNTDVLFQVALDNKVAFVPGTAFYPDNPPTNTFRLNFSNASADRIHEGVMRLGQAAASLQSASLAALHN